MPEKHVSVTIQKTCDGVFVKKEKKEYKDTVC